MKNIFNNFSKAILLAFVFTFTLQINNASAQEEVKALTPDKFEKATKKSKKAVILDIRTPEEVADGHIEGAEFADFLGDDFEKEISTLDKKKTYYVYCRSAKRTIPATAKMKEMGFKKVFMLEGGLNNWIESGKSVIKPE
ncbi:Rhodanese-related sulfurtransferase [Belliella baltica DSM 15883]|uniref:Rhodanese-related sulfurtransferase n=1 Tax=Belliella baltica (strain DSM 15883 / CIP 108006 / LMG 21964 / BA134) TaxID=866536 RepID=I3Z0G1_BELBD|nr:rhodanese-like domain-containing protein [Belliella baltica]AFL82729.1 Rhodanese-related sulfurtransferase [Belliella baltica DSM 15883]